MKEHPNGSDVALLADEMKLRDGLVYRNGEVSGYEELGDLNTAIERGLSENVSKPTDNIATHVLAYIIQGLKEHLNFPMAIYATKTASSTVLYHTMWDCVFAAEQCGFRVRVLVSDGATSNRKLMKIHKDDYPEDLVTYRCLNKYADRPLYFVSDVPHLLKTTRNAWENSGSHLKSRNLVVRSLNTASMYVIWLHCWYFVKNCNLNYA